MPSAQHSTIYTLHQKFRIFVLSSTHYCRLNKNSMEWEFYPTLLSTKWESNPIYPCIISRVWLTNEGCWYLGFVLTIVPYNTYDILHSFSPVHILIPILYPSTVHVYPLYVIIVHVYPLYCSILTSTFCCSIYCVGTYAHFNLTLLHCSVFPSLNTMSYIL